MTKLTSNDPIVFHFRLGKGKEMQSTVGATVAFMPEQKRFGIALCFKDDYCRKWGRQIAIFRATNGQRPRVQERRYNSSPSYSGPLEMESIKATAQALAYYAAEQVGNPLVSQASFIISDADKKALSLQLRVKCQ